MRPKDLKYLQLDQTVDLVTVVDRKKASESTPQELVGVTLARPGFVLNKDFGTTSRFASYPAGLSLRSSATVYDRDHDEYWTMVVGINGSNQTEIWAFIPNFGLWGQVTGIPSAFSINNGTDPHIRWLVTDSVKKFVLIVGDNPPLSIQRHDGRELYGGAIDEEAGWGVELHQLMPESVQIGAFDQGVQPEGDLGWDTLEYHYGLVTQDFEHTHVLTNNGVGGVTINGFFNTSGTYGSSVEYFEVTSDPTNEGANPVTLGAGESLEVKVQVNAVPGEGAQTNEQEAELRAETDSGVVVKTLKGIFKVVT